MEEEDTQFGVGGKNVKGGKGGGNCFLYPLKTVRVSQEKQQTETESNLWFDIGSPWLSVELDRGVICPPPGPLPAAVMNLLRPREWLMLLFMEAGKQVAAEFTSRTHFLGRSK